MRLVVSGICLMVVGLTLLFAMVARFVEPSLILSVSGFAITFVGMLLGVTGASRYVR